MVSNNVWVEATIHPDSATELNLDWAAGSSEPVDKLHVTMAFTTLEASALSWDDVLNLHTRLHGAVMHLDPLQTATVTIQGAAVFTPGKATYGVALVNSRQLWEHREALVSELGAVNEKTFPGWLPHITLASGVNNFHDIEALHRKLRGVKAVNIDGLWLRVGRACLPL